MECGDIFFASQTTRDMETAGTLTQHYLSFSRVKIKSPKENEEETNYIAAEQP